MTDSYMSRGPRTHVRSHLSPQMMAWAALVLASKTVGTHLQLQAILLQSAEAYLPPLIAAESVAAAAAAEEAPPPDPPLSECE